MPLLWLSLAFLSGILMGEVLSLPSRIWMLLGGLMLIAVTLPWLVRRLVLQAPWLVRTVISWLPPRLLQLISRVAIRFHRLAPLPLPIVLCAVFLGAARYQSAQPSFSPRHVAWYNDREIPMVVEGVVVEPPDVRDAYTGLIIRSEKISIQGEPVDIPVSGLVQARVQPGSKLEYGDRLRLGGLLTTPPEEETFSYRGYLARQGIFSILQVFSVDLVGRGQGNPFLAAVYAFKARLLELDYRLFPDPEGSLIAGILLGVEQGIPQDVQGAFQTTGTAHIIAISGFNIAILAGLFSKVFSRWLGRWRGALCSLLGIALYTVLVGPQASVVRAGLMGGLSLFAGQIGRRQDGVNSLAFVAALMALFNPFVLWDVGFQLSFAATLGLVLFADSFTEAFIRLANRLVSMPVAQHLAGPVGEYFLFTLAAQVTTLPIVLYHFQRLSISALVANPLILPAQPPLMILGGISLLAGVVFQPIGQVLAYLAWPFALFTIRVVEGFARLPGSSLPLGPQPLGLVAGFYAFLFLWVFGRRRLGERFVHLVKTVGPMVPLAGLGVFAILFWRSASTAPDGLLHVTLLDTSSETQSGEGLLIRTPTGRYMLVNGGPSATRLSDALGRRLPAFARRLDYLVVAGVKDGQLQALPPVLERYPAENVLWAGAFEASRAARTLHVALTEGSVPVTLAQPGQSLELGGGGSLKVQSVGEAGATLLLEWERFRLLLPLGITKKDLKAFGNGNITGPLTAIVLAGSGDAALNPPELLRDLQPQAVLLSVAAGDLHGLPDSETLRAVEGYSLLRTDRNGWIELTTDGESMWVVVEKHSEQ